MVWFSGVIKTLLPLLADEYPTPECSQAIFKEVKTSSWITPLSKTINTLKINNIIANIVILFVINKHFIVNLIKLIINKLYVLLVFVEKLHTKV